MAEKKRTRRSFLKTSGAVALAGLVGRAQFGCEPDHTDDRRRGPFDGDPEDVARLAALFHAPEALFRPTGSGCTVHWVSKAEVEARVLAGREPGELALVREFSASGPADVVIEGFTPDSDVFLQCQFRRKGDRKWIHRPVRRMHTARPPGTSFRVALIADSHMYACLQNAQAMRNVHKSGEAAFGDKPDFSIFLGDEAGIHTREAHFGPTTQNLAFERWRLWRITMAPLLAGCPSYFVLGNHEGEAGYYQRFTAKGRPAHLQRWGTIARKRYCLNPLPNTYPEGGENEGWRGLQRFAATGGAEEGNCSPLQNYFAWTWGDALFVVLDVQRYTNIGKREGPMDPQEWTLGGRQLRWFEQVLTSSRARWKFVIGHHVVGGSDCDASCYFRKTTAAYGRGGGRYALVGEQARITKIMRRAGAQFFLYGHDHVFAHQQADGIHFVCCGRTSWLQPQWWDQDGWIEAYGDTAARNPNDFYAAIGFARLSVSPEQVKIEYIRTGTDEEKGENIDPPEGQTVYEFVTA